MTEIKKAIAAELREMSEGLSWFGAQWNLVEPDSSWAGVSACRSVLDDHASKLESEVEVESVGALDPELAAIRSRLETEMTEYYEGGPGDRSMRDREYLLRKLKDVGIQ